jgi:type IV pilus assembly protein PilA
MKNKGFTLVELMVVVLIVGILAAVAIPIMKGRIDSAKWSEGKSMAGTIATQIRAYAAENGASGTWPPSMADLGISADELDGTYFSSSNFSWTAAYDALAASPLTFTITISNTGTGISTPTSVTLDQDGAWTP